MVRRVLDLVSMLFVLVLAFGSGPSVAPAVSAEITAKILRLDPRLDEVVAPGATPEKVLGGFTWVEGPLWSERDNTLLFSDIPHNRVIQWHPGRGWRVYLEHSGYTGSAPFAGWEPGSNGLAFDSQGRLLLCQHGNRRVIRLEKDGRITPLAERFQGRRLNSPNDMAMDAAGNLYFTDPPFGLPGTFDDPGKELAFQGVYRLGTDGRLDLLTKELRAPNGIGLSPDERTLYVTNTDPDHAVWMAYPLTAGGRLGEGRVLLDATADVKSLDAAGIRTSRPDGMKVDRAGNILGPGPGGLWIIAPDGTHLGTIAFPVPVSNCGFGGPEGRTLYITVDTSVWRVPIQTGKR